jgi:hypothetical protein
VKPIVISEEEARQILAEHLDDLTEVISAGWQDWQSLQQDAPRSALRSKKTRACWVSDAMRDKALELFDSKDGVVVSEKRGFVTLTFDNKLVLRFKKFSSGRLRTSGINTHQRWEFQTQQLHIEGLTVTTLVAGYLLDSLEQYQKKVAITCPVIDENEWVIDLELPIATPIVIPPQAPVTAPVTVIISKSAKSAKKKDAEEA